MGIFEPNIFVLYWRSIKLSFNWL